MELHAHMLLTVTSAHLHHLFTPSKTRSARGFICDAILCMQFMGRALKLVLLGLGTGCSLRGKAGCTISAMVCGDIVTVRRKKGASKLASLATPRDGATLDQDRYVPEVNKPLKGRVLEVKGFAGSGFVLEHKLSCSALHCSLQHVLHHRSSYTPRAEAMAQRWPAPNVKPKLSQVTLQVCSVPWTRVLPLSCLWTDPLCWVYYAPCRRSSMMR